MHKVVPAFAFRARARMAMKPVMSILLVVALIASLPSLISSTVTLLTGASPESVIVNFSNRTMQVMEKYGLDQMQGAEIPQVDEAALEADVLAVYEAFFTEMETFSKEKGAIVIGLALMVALTTPVLTMGLINALLHALRRKEFTASIVLSCLRYYPKVLGLELLLTLKYLLWMLPGVVILIASIWLPENLMEAGVLIGTLTAAIPLVMAIYRYAMAIFVLADNPETSIRSCIRRSCEVMKRRKLELFSLELSFIGWSLLLSYVRLLLDGMLGPVLGMTLGQFAALFLTVYTNCAMAAFYQEYAVGPLPSPEAREEAAPADDTLND